MTRRHRVITLLGALGVVGVLTFACGGSGSGGADGTDGSVPDARPTCKPGDTPPYDPGCNDCPGNPNPPMTVCINGYWQCQLPKAACPPGPCAFQPILNCGCGTTAVCVNEMYQCTIEAGATFEECLGDAGKHADAAQDADGAADASTD